MEINNSKTDFDENEYSRHLSNKIFNRLKKATKKIEDENLRQRIKSSAVLLLLDSYHAEISKKIPEEIEFRIIRKFEKAEDINKDIILNLNEVFMAFMKKLSLQVVDIFFTSLNHTENSKLAFEISKTILEKKLKGDVYD